MNFLFDSVVNSHPNTNFFQKIERNLSQRAYGSETLWGLSKITLPIDKILVHDEKGPKNIFSVSFMYARRLCM